MTRAAVVQRIERLTDEEFERVEPYLVADLEHASDPDGLLEAIRLGRESARTEPLIDNEEVFAMARRRRARP